MIATTLMVGNHLAKEGSFIYNYKKRYIYYSNLIWKLKYFILQSHEC